MDCPDVATCPKLSKDELAKKPECDAVLALGHAVKDRSGSIGKLPFGWPNGFDASSITWSRVLGWLLTGFAASLGAPFWFDLLNRISNVRRVSARPEPKAPETAAGTRPERTGRERSLQPFVRGTAPAAEAAIELK